MNIGILGHGVVGQGVATLLVDHAGRMEARCGQPMRLHRIADLRDFSHLPYADRFTKDAWQVVRDPEIDLVAEMMGGVNPAFDFVAEALRQGKHVVTSNKALVAAKGPELTRLAVEKQVFFLYEASVGGGIPVLRPLTQCLAANDVTVVEGILNGTTNFMLSRMQEGLSYGDALALAQKLGYAERDPHDDVAGVDAQRKLAILATLASERFVDYQDLHVEGIEWITTRDMRTAEVFGGCVRLVARTQRTAEGVAAYVVPMVLPRNHTLAQVEDVYNGVLIRGDAVEDVFFRGRGAGSMPTASAVMGDIIFAARYAGSRILPPFDVDSRQSVLDYDYIPGKFLLRTDQPVKGWDSRPVDGEYAVLTPLTTPMQLRSDLRRLEGVAFSGAPLRCDDSL